MISLYTQYRNKEIWLYLYIPTNTAKNVGYFSLSSREIVRINFKLIL